jgi:hypothetical protein
MLQSPRSFSCLLLLLLPAMHSDMRNIQVDGWALGQHIEDFYLALHCSFWFFGKKGTQYLPLDCRLAAG